MPGLGIMPGPEFDRQLGMLAKSGNVRGFEELARRVVTEQGINPAHAGMITGLGTPHQQIAPELHGGELSPMDHLWRAAVGESRRTPSQALESTLTGLGTHNFRHGAAFNDPRGYVPGDVVPMKASHGDFSPHSSHGDYNAGTVRTWGNASTDATTGRNDGWGTSPAQSRANRPTGDAVGKIRPVTGISGG